MESSVPKACSIKDVLDDTAARPGPFFCTGLSGTDRVYFTASYYLARPAPMVVVCPNEKEAARFLGDLDWFLNFLAMDRPLGQVIRSFPGYQGLPFKGAGFHAETAAQRIATLHGLLQGAGPFIIVTTIQAVMARVIPRQVLSACAELVMEGEDLDRAALVEKLAASGYASSLVVEEPGEFSVRGGILDVFSPLYEHPLRLEFFGDTVDSIRFFSPMSQMTLSRTQEAIILPATEAVVEKGGLSRLAHKVREQALLLEMPVTAVRDLVAGIKSEGRFAGVESFLPLVYASCDTFFDYLPPGAICVLPDPDQIELQAAKFEQALRSNHEAAALDKRLCLAPERTHVSSAEVLDMVSGKNSLRLPLVPVKGRESHPFVVQDNAVLRQEMASSKDREHLLLPLADWMRDKRERGMAVVCVCQGQAQAERLEGLLAPYGVAFGQGTGPGSARLVLGPLLSGFVWEAEKLAVATDSEIFGPKRRKAKESPQGPRTDLLDFSQLKQGDYIVHVEHGIGQYQGLVNIKIKDVSNDFLLLCYRDADRLYLPVDRTNLIQKYRGMGEAQPALDKLGGKSWERVKKTVKKSVEKIAGELLEIYASRKAGGGFSFPGPDTFFREFEAGFTYEETPDQARAIQDVLADMERPEPMDRLVCGDVGYGKTEVALRASFLAVNGGKQVAVLAPTTILAEQHFRTFSERFKGYAVNVACLNRFRTPQEQKAICARVEKGEVDVAIGTHRLLQKDVAFRDLGLLIVDEEQRFGVRHKEKLKKLRSTVDVLAMTATPIPRTLHLSLSGLRDISVINTPPEQRRPITTFICPLEDAIVAEAVERELARGGQVFFVHNRVQSIGAVARRVAGLAPSARVAVAHGQLNEAQLEKVMLSFINRQADVLVCTAIIESGLDIPGANTILINRADMFGLAQIYQLRGRVGRSDEQAYAYLFIPPDSVLTRDAQKRLKVLMEHPDLGAGFQIAMSDLQIRGGGTILGASQSGHVAQVGYEMYLELLENAVMQLKGQIPEAPLEPEINVDFSSFFPESYIPDTDQRLSAYRRLARSREPAMISEIQTELSDRFGKPPREAVQLFYKIMLKILCRRAGVRRLDLAGTSLALSLSPEHVKRPGALFEMARRPRSGFSFSAEGVFKAALSGTGVQARVKETKNLLNEIAQRVNF